MIEYLCNKCNKLHYYKGSKTTDIITTCPTTKKAVRINPKQSSIVKDDQTTQKLQKTTTTPHKKTTKKLHQKTTLTSQELNFLVDLYNLMVQRRNYKKEVFEQFWDIIYKLLCEVNGQKR